MGEIRPGDVVVEESARFSCNWEDRIGVLLREYNDHAWGHWVIQTNNGEFDWYNCKFYRIPVTEHQLRLFGGHGDRCEPSCKDCEREMWSLAGRNAAGHPRWDQVLR